MQRNSKVHFIPPIPKREKRVGIYCHVSTNSTEQLQSLTAKVSHLTRLTATMPQYVLADVYMDVATSKTGSSRKEFNRMVEDCKSHKLNLILTKSISRFGRDTVEILEALNMLKQCGVRVIFEQEELDTEKTDSDLIIAVIEALKRAENESRSDNIKMGIKYCAAAGTSKLYDRRCFGYTHDENGKLVIDEESAGIVKELEKRQISSPTGKKWCKRTVDVMLSNKKYTGNVRLLKSGNSEVHYLASDNNSVIISKEVFEAVQTEKKRRTNEIMDGNRSIRKKQKYSSKN